MHHRERGAGAFRRAVPIPGGLGGARPETLLKNGVLTVAIDKSGVSSSRRIPVNRAGEG